MQILPKWSERIGDGDVRKLFHMQTNLRFGCVLFRHFFDLSKGNENVALKRYLIEAAGIKNDAALLTIFSEISSTRDSFGN